MNSVISAFKGKKSSTASSNPANGAANGAVSGESKQNHAGGLSISIASVGGGVAKKKPVAQSSGYQYLRHIREIESANKLLSPVVVVAEDRPIGKVGSATSVTAVTGVDVVDHCLPHTVRLSSTTEALSDFNMNGKAVATGENANLESTDTWNCSQMPPAATTDDDDLSEHSAAACTSTSSSSEHSNSTVVHSPTVAAVSASGSASASASISHPSPSLSLHSTSSASCGMSSPHSQSSLAITCEPQSTSTTTLSSLGSDGGNGNGNYIPAFLTAAPITLPIGGHMPTSEPGASSAASTPKHTRYSKPRLSLSRGFNHSMPSVHGRTNLSVAQSGDGAPAAAIGGAANPPKRISTHQRNLSLDFR